MRTYPATLSTTHVDSQGDQATKRFLEQAAQTLNSVYVPLGYQHDPRLPPTGRIASGRVEPIGRGEFALTGTLEVWEQGDTPDTLTGDGRTIPEYSTPAYCFEVHYDLPSARDLGLDFLEDLARIAQANAKPRYHAKKAAEPLSTLTIAIGAFLLGNIANGFLGRLGEDAYNALKARLKNAASHESHAERLYCIHAGVRTHARIVTIDILVANPSPTDVEFLLGQGLRSLDDLVDRTLMDHPRAAKLVVELSGQELRLLYWVRDDGVPSLIRPISHDELMAMGLSFSGLARIKTTDRT